MSTYTASDFYLFEAQMKAQGRLGPGRTFWVGNGVAQFGGNVGRDVATGIGENPLEPLATIQYALTNYCTASRGDNIIVLPGHAESIIAAGTLTAATAGVTVLGMGNGALRPTLTWGTNTAATMLVTGASIVFDNFIFVCALDQVVTMQTVSGADCAFKNCEWRLNGNLLAGSTYALIGVTTTATALRLAFKNCKFRGAGSGAEAATGRHTSAIQIVGGDGILIDGCDFDGKWQVTATQLGAIDIQTTATTNLRVLNSFIAHRTSTSTFAVSDTITASTGLVDNCHLYVGTGSTPISGATLTWGLNYYTTANATSMGAA